MYNSVHFRAIRQYTCIFRQCFGIWYDTYKQTDKQTSTQTDRQTNRQTDRQMSTQTCRPVDELEPPDKDK